MNTNESTEKLILKISLFAGIFFVIVEFLMAIYSKSQSILMDAAFDGSELIVIAASLLLTPLLYKPVTERTPFGYAQCESLFIIVKGFMLVAVTLSLIGSNIQVMLNGGNLINANLVLIFELLLTILSIGVLLVLKYYGKALNSPMITAEIYGWKIDAICGMGVALAFIIPLFLQHTKWIWITPYFDQIVAIILAITMLPEPIKMVFHSMRELLLFAPSEAVIEELKELIEPVCSRYGQCITFLDLVQTGRKTWVSITLENDHEIWYRTELKDIHEAIMELLNQQYEEVYLEIIPELYPQ
ncbi:MAG: cation diffusion facilitator family transporter [Lachnospiraceae bacterium]